MTIHDLEPAPMGANETETTSSQQGCERLPAIKAEAADLQRAIDHATAEIDRLEGEFRALRAQPGSPNRDSKLIELSDAVAAFQTKRYQDSNEMSRKLDDIRDLESRCIRQA
jgi:chromosome segregation ATPase